MGDIKVWLKGLIAAAISGVGTGAAAMTIAPGEFAFDYHKLAQIALAGAVVGVVGYLVRSPLPVK